MDMMDAGERLLKGSEEESRSIMVQMKLLTVVYNLFRYKFLEPSHLKS